MICLRPCHPPGRGHPPMTSITYLRWMLGLDEQSRVTAEQIASACNLDLASVKAALQRDVARGRLLCEVADASCGGRGRYAYWLRPGAEADVRQYIDAWQAYLDYLQRLAQAREGRAEARRLGRVVRRQSVKLAPSGLVVDALAGRTALESAWVASK